MVVEGVFRVLNWNIGGAKYLELKAKEGSRTPRDDFRDSLNQNLVQLLKDHNPDVVALQEVVRYRDGEAKKAQDVVDVRSIGRLGYHYWPRWLIDTHRHGHQGKWNNVRDLGGWSPSAYFAQGNALLVKKSAVHCGIWEIPVVKSEHREVSVDEHGQPGRRGMEVVTLESGLYFGDRNTEPRAALIAHFVLSELGHDEPLAPLTHPLDIFVVNLHLTTLMMEREGVPEIDEDASQTRLRQLETVLNGIISRYNSWRRKGFPVRDKHIRLDETAETRVRHNPIWVVCGDFNFTPESLEYHTSVRRGLMDMMGLVERHGRLEHAPTKSQGISKGATITVDYVFAGPRFEAIDPVYAVEHRHESTVIDNVRVSDHLPLLANIPIRINDPIPKDKADRLRGQVTSPQDGKSPSRRRREASAEGG